MRHIALLSLTALVAALAVGCSSVTVDSDFDHDVDFSKYKTFAWYDHSGAEHQPQRPNQIVDARIHRAMAEELIKKGFTQTAPDTADFLVTYYTSTESKIDVYHSGYGYGYGYWGGWWGPYGMPTTQVTQYDVGTLIVDIIDGSTNDLVWRGMIQKALAGNEGSEEKVKGYVAQVLKSFPPGRHPDNQ